MLQASHSPQVSYFQQNLNFTNVFNLHTCHSESCYQSFTVAINELLCMKNAGAQIAMDFS